MKNKVEPVYKAIEFDYGFEVSRSAARSQPIALCTGDGCRSKKRSGRGNTGKRSEVGVRKDVTKNTDWCPDCGDALFWMRENC